MRYRGLPWALVRGSTLPAAALVPMVETGECGDVGTRARHRSDDTCLFTELRYGIVARQHENGFKCGYISGFRSDPLYVHTPKLQSTPTVRAGPRMLGVGVRHPQAARSARG